MVRSAFTLGLLLLAWLLALASQPGADDDDDVPLSAACAELIRVVCGDASECQGLTACEAAELLGASDDTGKRCHQALLDPLLYPPCELTGLGPQGSHSTDCENLVDVVCGQLPDGATERPCDQQITCLNAKLLADVAPVGGEDGSLERWQAHQDDCAAAQQERALYPVCQP